MIPIRRPCMEYVLITQKLYIPHLEHHVQFQTVTRLLQHLRRLFLLRRERRNEPGVREAGQGANKIGVPFRVDSAQPAGLEEEDGGADPLLLANTNLALAVEIPYRLS